MVDLLFARLVARVVETVCVPIEVVRGHRLDPRERLGLRRGGRSSRRERSWLKVERELLLPVVRLQVGLDPVRQPSVRRLGRVRRVWSGVRRGGGEEVNERPSRASIVPEKSLLTYETLVCSLLLESEFLLPSLVVLDRPLPYLVALEVLARVLGVGLLPQTLGEPLLLLEVGELLGRRLVPLVLRDQILAVRSRRRILFIGPEERGFRSDTESRHRAWKNQTRICAYHLYSEVLELLLPLLERQGSGCGL